MRSRLVDIAKPSCCSLGLDPSNLECCVLNFTHNDSLYDFHRPLAYMGRSLEAKRLRDGGVRSLTDAPLVETVTRPNELSTWLTRAGIDPASVRVRQRYDHFYVALQAIINGYGCGVGSLQVLEHEIAAGRIEVPFPEVTTPGVEYQLIQPATGEHPLAERFVAWLSQTA